MRGAGLLSSEKRRLRGDLNTLKGAIRDQSLFPTYQEIRGNSLKLHQGRFRKNLTGRVVKYWDGLPREGAEAPSLGGFNRSTQMQRSVTRPNSVLGRAALKGGPDHPRGLFQPKLFHDLKPLTCSAQVTISQLSQLPGSTVTQISA